MSKNNQSALVIAISSLAALLFSVGGTGCNTAGITIVAALAIRSLSSSWWGLLSLFPMLFAVRPAPPAIGPAEASFALLAAVSLLSSLVEEVKVTGWFKLTLRYGLPVTTALVWAGVNLFMAGQNEVPLSDWVRGAAPFCFLIFALPLARALQGHSERLAWVGWAVAAYLLMLMGHIASYYIAHALYEPYWLVGQGRTALRIAGKALVMHPNATGPYIDRITIYLPRATTVLMAAGMVMTFVVTVRTKDWRLSIVAGILSALCLLAMLVTYTRSILLVSAIAILAFIAALAWFNRARLVRAFVMLILLFVWGGAAIWTFDMGSLWSYRMASYRIGAMGEALTQDANVTSRVQEIRMAWGQFQQHPILGNGLGIKNPITYVGNNGPVEQQVAYIHNWFFYSLMVGGLVGCGLYAWLLFSPVIWGWRDAATEPLMQQTARFGMLAFVGYGLIFAVFRQIDFNLLLAAAWGIMLAPPLQSRDDA